MTRRRKKMMRMWWLMLFAGVGFPGAEAPADPAKVAPEVDAILGRVEAKGDEIRDLSCKLVYRINDRLNFDELVKYGTIKLKRAQPHAMFLITFDKLVQDDIATHKKEWYLFKDRWLWEARDRSRTIIKREIVEPGRTVDLFDVETAPFPMPFGQKKEAILKNFTVRLLPPAPSDPPGTDHLVCTPKPEMDLAKDYDTLEFFVSRKLELPVKIIATEPKGRKVITAEFSDLKVSTGLTERDFSEPAAWKGYSISEEPLPKPQQLPVEQPSAPRP